MLYVQPINLQMSRPLPPGAANDPARERQALQELEHFFLYTLLGEMRKTIEDGGLFEHGAGMKTFEDLMDDAIAMKMAESGQMGIADAIEQQLHAHDIQQQVTPERNPKAEPPRLPD